MVGNNRRLEQRASGGSGDVEGANEVRQMHTLLLVAVAALDGGSKAVHGLACAAEREKERGGVGE